MNDAEESNARLQSRQAVAWHWNRHPTQHSAQLSPARVNRARPASGRAPPRSATGRNPHSSKRCARLSGRVVENRLGISRFERTNSPSSAISARGNSNSWFDDRLTRGAGCNRFETGDRRVTVEARREIPVSCVSVEVVSRTELPVGSSRHEHCPRRCGNSNASSPTSTPHKANGDANAAHFDSSRLTFGIPIDRLAQPFAVRPIRRIVDRELARTTFWILGHTDTSEYRN